MPARGAEGEGDEDEDARNGVFLGPQKTEAETETETFKTLDPPAYTVKWSRDKRRGCQRTRASFRGGLCSNLASLPCIWPMEMRLQYNYIVVATEHILSSD